MAIDNRFGGNMEQSNSGIRGIRRGLNNLSEMGPGIAQMSQRAGAYGSGTSPNNIRQGSINLGQQAGLGNRISFAGESGRDILNPNEMKVNAPSVEGWEQEAQRKIMMDRMDQGNGPMYGRSETSGLEKFLNPIQNAGQGLMDLLGSGYNKLDEILDFKGMKEQIPYLLDNFIPGYEPPEGYYDDDYDGEPMEEYPRYDPNNPNHFMAPEGMDPELFMPGVETLEAGMGMNSYDVADLDDDNIAAQILASQGYGNEDIISMLSSRSI